MAHLYKKQINGRTYWYLRETVRVGKKVKVKWQKYLGTPDTILEKLTALKKAGSDISAWKLKSQEFGSVFIADALEKLIGTIDIVDSIVPSSSREKGPSVGEYFFYAWVNRLIDPQSKNSTGKWFAQTAIEHIRNIRTTELNSARFWEKWDRVSEEQIEKIGRAFFEKVWEQQKVSPDCMMFDTTNYYSYMSSKTESDLFERGHNKAGKHYLRQVGLALLVESESGLPLYSSTYEGNLHDSQLFNRIIDEMFGVMCGFSGTKERLTVVFDKGMNSEANISHIDDHQRVHFVTTYSPKYAEEIARTDLSMFRPLDLSRNKKLLERGQEADQLLAYRSSINLWGKVRTVIVTYNPSTMRKKEYVLMNKLEKIREKLFEFRRNFRSGKPHWKSFDKIIGRYRTLCEKMHIGAQYYDLNLCEGGKDFSFRKNVYQVTKAQGLFGRNLIITDNSDWTDEMIVSASLDRYLVEQRFRDSKSHRHVSVNPIYHWTDSKIRCHLLVCVIALTMKRLLELKLNSCGGKWSAETVIEEMRKLDLITCWSPGQSKPVLKLEEPNELQSVVLKIFNADFQDGWVLQS